MTYLERRSVRIALGGLKKTIIFGMVVSSMLLGVGAWRYFMTVGANDALWAAAATAGAIGWIVALVLPSLWKSTERGFGMVVGKIGGVLFATLLAVIYAFLVAPVGWILRKWRGTAPIYAWTGSPLPAMEGWRRKEVLYETQLGKKRGRAKLTVRFVRVLQFFASRGHYLFLPSLVILLALGAVLFFVKTSALAPFIYTLF